jgi:hypothetical protein
VKTRFQNSTRPFPGNNRLSFMRNAGTVAIVKETNYYPFGLTHQGYNNLTTSLGSAGAKKYMYHRPSPLPKKDPIYSFSYDVLNKSFYVGMYWKIKFILTG